MTRQSFLKGLFATVFASIIGGLYAFLIEPALRLRVKTWSIQRDDWTAPALKIVAISDIHVGEPHVSKRRLETVVKRANALGGDIIVLLGDYVASHPFVTRKVPFEDIASTLADLTAPNGVYAILGNHDWWDDKDAQQRGSGPNAYGQALESAGITVLSNKAQKLENLGIWLAGLEDQLAIIRRNGGLRGLDDLEGTLAQIEDGLPCVMLAHEPDVFARMTDRVALTLSGHTHGGQVRLFGWSPVVPSRFGNRYAYGHVREGKKDLVVSGGIGCAIAPIRFGVVPEITVIEISGT